MVREETLRGLVKGTLQACLFESGAIERRALSMSSRKGMSEEALCEPRSSKALRGIGLCAELNMTVATAES